jgi:hypothetical protein
MLSPEEEVEAYALCQQGWKISRIARHPVRSRATIRATRATRASSTSQCAGYRAEVCGGYSELGGESIPPANVPPSCESEREAC